MKKIAALLVVLAPLAARADEGKLPFNPYEKAEKGDWCVLKGTLRAKGSGEKSICAVFSRVVKVENGSAAVNEESQVAPAKEGAGPRVIDKANKTFSTKEVPEVAAYFGLKDGKAADLKVADDKKTVCGKELACKKVSFLWKHDSEACDVTAWLSLDVKAGGLVAFEMDGRAQRTDATEVTSTWKLELAGSGSAEKTDLGESPDDCLDESMLGEPDEATELPFNPFANVKKGDWAAVRVEASFGGRSERAVTEFTVRKVTAESVEVNAAAWQQGREQGKQTLSFDPKKAPQILEYIGVLVKGEKRENTSGATVSGVKVGDDKHTVGDKEFDCKRLSFTVKEHGSSAKVKLWMSPEVKVIGFVAAEIKIAERDQTIAFTMEIGGYGTPDTAEWGKLAEDLAKKAKKKKTGDDE